FGVSKNVVDENSLTGGYRQACCGNEIRSGSAWSVALGCDLGYVLFVGVSHHPGYAGHRRQLFGSALGVTAGYQNFAVGVVALEAAYLGTSVLISFGCHRTCVKHHKISVFSGLRALHAALQQLPVDCSTVRLRRAAPEA